jgi:hypothetical protein
MFNNDKCDQLRSELKVLLSQWAKRNNLRIDGMNFRYNPYDADLKIRLVELSETGERQVPEYIMNQLKDMLKGTFLEGQSPLGHWFRTSDGSRAQLLGFIPNRKFNYDIKWYNKRGVLKDGFCDLRYLKGLKEPIE